MIPTRKIVDFLGIRAMGDEVKVDPPALQHLHIDHERLRQEKSRAVAIEALRALIMASLFSDDESHEVVPSRDGTTLG